MAISPSSSVQRAREQLAARLRDIRKDAHLSAQDLSAAAGWHKAKTSRIESAKQAPSEDDLRTWCLVCGAEHEVPDLIAASRAADLMYVEYRRLNMGGLRRLQEPANPLFLRTRRFKSYCPAVIPGFLQVPGYASALLSSIAAFREIPDDTQQAVTARMNRNRILGDGNRRFTFIVEEEVLRHQLGESDMMTDQLGHLLEVMDLPGVTLGIVPFTAQRPMWPLEAFTVFDDERVVIELLSAQVTVTSPSEITLYVRAFERLGRLAAFGADARGLISAAIDVLR